MRIKTIFKFACTIATLLSFSSLLAQSPIMLWEKSFGKPGTEEAYELIETQDGGLALVGYSSLKGRGKQDFWFAKTNKFGQKEWEKTYGGLQNDVARCVIQTSDGGYLLGGYTESYGKGKSDAWLIKTTSEGLVQWQQHFGGKFHDETIAVIETKDEGFAVLANRFVGDAKQPQSELGDEFQYLLKQQIWLFKLNKNGEREWEQFYFNNDYNSAAALVQTLDGGFAITGNTLIPNKKIDGWLIKTDAKGNTVWSKFYGGDRNDYFTTMFELPDGSLTIAGTTVSSQTRKDAWLLKTDQAGKVLNNIKYGGEDSEKTQAVVSANDGNLLMVANVAFPEEPNEPNVWIMEKVSLDGKYIWRKIAGNKSIQLIRDLIETREGGIVMLAAGSSQQSPSDPAKVGGVKLIKLAAFAEKP